MSANTTYDHFSDKELVQHYLLTKKAQWLNVLFKRYSLLVYGVCMKYMKNDANAQDATQQVFEKCIIELPKYEVQFFKSWLYQITKNYCLMQLRKKNEFSSDDMTQYQQIVNEEQEREQKNELIKKDETLELLHNSLSELTVEQRQCIELFYLEKKSYQQISEITNFNYLQVKSFIQNGKRNLKLIVLKKQANIFK